MEQILETKLHVGLEKPVKIFHMTDVHLVDYAPDDNPEQIEHLIKRKEVFRKEANYPPKTQNEYFAEGFELAKAEGATVVVGGDVIDVFAKGTVAEFMRLIAGQDFLYTPGSHEFAEFARAPKDSSANDFRDNARNELQKLLFPHNFFGESRVVGGLNIVCLDNSGDYYSKETLEFLEKEIDKGLPILVFSHEPIGDYSLLRYRVGNPITQRSPEEYMISDKVLMLLETCPLIKATFGGHWHGTGERGSYVANKPFFVTGGLFKGICRMIEVD